MKFLYKRLLWVFFIVLALFTIVSVYLGRHFIGIGPVPTRSAFAGRLPSTIDGDQRRFQFFYSTNRENSDETFEERGNILSDTFTRGTFDTFISPYIQIVPFVWFDAAHIKWAGRQELSQEAFIPKLREAVQNSPHKSLLVIVWGFRDWFQSAALKTAYTAYVLDINTPVLLFDWPGNQGEGFRGYADSRLVATKAAPDLGKVLAEVMNETDAEHIWLMGSSLGCQTICDALVWMSEQSTLIKDHHKLDHVVLSAPDVSANAFNDKFAEVIQKLSDHLTAYVSSNDRALLMSHWVNGKRRLGRTAEVSFPPEHRKSEYEFEEAMELLDLQEKGARHIAVVDATPINRLRNLHHFFTDSPVFFDDLYQRLIQPDDIVSRRLHTIRTQADGPTYWILWND